MIFRTTFLFLFLISLLLTGCIAPPPATGSQPLPLFTPTASNPAMQAGEAWATAQAAQTQAQLAAQRATTEAQLAAQAAAAATAQVEQAALGTMQAQAATATVVAGTATAVYASTADALAFRATAIALDATATAVSAQAAAAQRLIDDEARRLALQRANEAADLAYRQRLNQVKPILWGMAALSLLLLTAAVVWFLMQRAQPVIIPDAVHGPQVLIPSGSYQVLSPPTRLSLPAPPVPRAPSTNTTETAVPDTLPLPPLATGHVLIAGETGSGKSTALLAVLGRRQGVVVLDPHDDGHTWGQARVIGGGRDFVAIGGFMEHMQTLLSERYQQRAQGQRQFAALTVATDEMPAIVSALGRDMDAVWRTWLREGRKVGLFFVVCTQSTRVRTLGIRGEGDLLQNFTYVVLLGKLAAAGYPQLVQGMTRPAILRTSTTARPVVIPYAGAMPALAETAVSASANPVPTRSRLTADSFPTNADTAPIYADPTQVTPAAIARIQQLRAAGYSQRAIETAVFGYTGGAAYQAVRAALSGTATGESCW